MSTKLRHAMLTIGALMLIFATSRGMTMRLLSNEDCMKCSDSSIDSSYDLTCGDNECNDGCTKGFVVLYDPTRLIQWCDCPPVEPYTEPAACHMQVTRYGPGVASYICVGGCNETDCPSGSECDADPDVGFPKSCKCEQ